MTESTRCEAWRGELRWRRRIAVTGVLAFACGLGIQAHGDELEEIRLIQSESALKQAPVSVTVPATKTPPAVKPVQPAPVAPTVSEPQATARGGKPQAKPAVVPAKPPVVPAQSAAAPAKPAVAPAKPAAAPVQPAEAPADDLAIARAEVARLEALVTTLQKEKQQALVNAYYNMGCVYRAVGQYRRAEEEFLKALKLVPDDPGVHFNLGVLYEDNLRNRVKARHHYERFVELAPQDPDAGKVKEWLLTLK